MFDDKQLLTAYLENDLSFSGAARELGTSRQAVHERLGKLEKIGVKIPRRKIKQGPKERIYSPETIAEFNAFIRSYEQS